MTAVPATIAGPLLADRLLRRSKSTDVVLIVAGAALTAIAAQVTVPLIPVPVTGQTLAVLLVGSSLGAVRGSLSLILYAMLGICGLPVFSDLSKGYAVFAGPTGGYLIGFVCAAALTGWLAGRQRDRRLIGACISFLAGTVVIFAIGLPWLAFSQNLSATDTLRDGLYPFAFGGVVKSVVAAAIIRICWLGVARAEARGSLR